MTIRTTIVVAAAVAGAYVLAVGAYVTAVLAPSAHGLRARAETLQVEYAALGVREAELRGALSDVHGLIRARVSGSRIGATGARASLLAIAERSAGVQASLLLTGIPATMRTALADAAVAESRMAGVLLETLEYVDAGDLAAARLRLAGADRPQTLLRARLDDVQRLGLAEVVLGERVLETRARRVVEALAVWVGLGTALLALFVLTVRRRFYQPLEALDRGLAGVAGGDLRITLPVRRADELGRLTAQFNQMADVLRARAEEERRLATSLLDTQEATFRISDAASKSATLHDLFAAIHRIVGELMPARNFYIALEDAGSGEITFPYFVDEFDAPPAAKPPGKGLTELVLRTGEPLLATPEVALALERRGEVEMLGAPSIDWLGVPLKPNGHTIGVLVVQSYTAGVRFTDRHRDILQYVSTQVAMTIERKRAEEAVRQSEERYRTLVDGVEDVIFALAPDGTLAALNPVFERITGWKRDAWLGKPFAGLLHPDDVATARQLYAAVLEGQPRPTAQLRVRTRGGEYRLGEFHTSVQRREGQVTGVFGIVRDITDRVRLEEQLRQAQKMEAVGQVASGVAHDFNNLLTAVLSSADLLRAALPAGAPALDDVRTIGDAARRGAELTGKLLAFSRRQPLTLRPVSLGAAAGEFIRMARRLVPEHVTIAIEVEARDTTIRGDAGALQQILLNLVTNARDAMPRGGTVRIEVARSTLSPEHVRTHAWGVPGHYVTLTVSDTGCGMDADTQSHIFEPFFTTKPVGQGTGLGMPMVYGLVKDHAGFLQVHSEPLHGTTIRLYFPAVAGAPVEPVAEVAPEARGGSETILLVEDSDEVRHATTRVLERNGYTVIGVRDGEEALRALGPDGDRAQLIVTDVVMPNTSGPELVQKLRERGLAVRLLLTSGYTAREVQDKASLDPTIPFLAKPWSVADLLRKVREALEAPGLATRPRRRATDR